MTPAPQEYIMTEDEWQSLKIVHGVLATHGAESDAWLIMENVHSRPYTSASSDVLEIEMRFESMKADNRMREIRGESPAYIGKQFDELIDDLLTAELRQQTKEP
jgi:hypothetical protein